MRFTLRFGTAAALVCLALTAPIHGAERGEQTLSTPAAIKRDAHHFGEAVRENSKRFGHEVSRGAHQFKDGVKRWWSQMRRSAREA